MERSALSRGARLATMVTLVLGAATLGAAPAADADAPCPPLVDFVQGVPLPPRVGVSGSVTPFSPSDSALLPAFVPAGGLQTRVNLTITAQSIDYDVVPTVTFSVARVSGFDSTLGGVLTCATPYLQETVTGAKGVWSTQIKRTVFIPDPAWNSPDFHLHVTGTTFADWSAEITPCYIPRGVIVC